MSFRTVDLVDAYQQSVRACSVQFRQYGAVRSFCGTIRTLRVREDNALVRRVLETPGEGCVLVVDGGASLRTALAGDQIAALGVRNGWAGLIFYGAIRDVEELARLPIGIKALGSNPMKSAKNGAGETDVTLSFGDVDFVPGGYLYSDEDGVLVCGAALEPLVSA